jgi:predicted nucleic acid-binding protein
MKMTIVLDCNVIVMCLTSRSPYHAIYQSLINGKYSLAVNTDIVLEYEEVIQQKYGTATANAFITLLKELPNVLYVNSSYK